MNNCKIECTESQLKLIQKALDLYSRVGCGQFSEIKDHPTFQTHLEDVCRPKKTPEVGDRTPQGEILEIKGKKALINGGVKNGMWDKEPTWIKLEDVKLSTDYSKYHLIRDVVDNMFVEVRKELIQDKSLGRNADWGIYNPKVDETARTAFSILKKIRHQFWLNNPNKTNFTVDSYDGDINVIVTVDELLR